MGFNVYAEEGGSSDYVSADNFVIEDGAVIFYNGEVFGHSDVEAVYSLENIYKFR